MGGNIFSREGEQTRAQQHDQTSEPLQNGHNGHVAENVDILPTTKVPALDTIDQYALETPLPRHLARVSSSTRLLYTANISGIADDVVRGYAFFISEFTGLDDLAFSICRSGSPWASGTRHRVICASFSRSDSEEAGSLDSHSPEKLQELDFSSYDENEIQFVLEFVSGARPENGEQQSNSNSRDSFVLTVQPEETPNEVRISISCSGRLIPEVSIKQILKTLSSYLVKISSHLDLVTSDDKDASFPELSIINYPPLMKPPPLGHEREEDIPESSLLHGAFERWARRDPGAVALDFIHSLPSATSPAEHSVLTYAALNAAATNLAVHLRGLLSRHDAVANWYRIIPVYMSTSPELYISYLGILKAGYAFSPIPQDAPDQRVREILGDIGSPVILGRIPEPSSGPRHEGLEHCNCGSRPAWIDVAEISRWKELSQMSLEELQVRSVSDLPRSSESGEDSVAYLLFTSGSTGKPKGVQVSHLSAACSINAHATSIPLPRDSNGRFRWFQFASPTFDPSLMEIFVTLSSGAALCAAYRHLTLTDLETTVNEARATVMMATPSLAALLRPSRLETLQYLWTMGEKLNRTVIENFSAKELVSDPTDEKQPSRMLVNAYGPTEGAINCTFLAPVEHSVRGSIIGEALPTCTMLVLDPHSRVPKPVPTGMAGELAIAGPQVSKGYLNRPQETAKSFVHSSEFGPVYRTGDMARIVWDEHGRQLFEFLGRISSDQVKISGRRLELGEIESVLATVNNVTEVVAVLLQKDPTQQGSEQIIACVVPSETTDAVKDQILRDARENTHKYLASYMCPSSYAFYDALPRSSSGKVDRKALLAKLQQALKDGVKFAAGSEAPVTNGAHQEEESDDSQVEDQALQQLVFQSLAATSNEPLAAIRSSVSLYALGIDSLGAMRLLQKLRDSGIDGLSVSDVLRAGTPGRLVSEIFQQRQKSIGQASDRSQSVESRIASLQEKLLAFDERNRHLCAERLQVDAQAIEKVLPTTATQSGMLASFIRSLSEATHSKRSYIYHSIIRLESGVDIERLKAAWNSVIASYDSFRTVFCMLDDELAPFAQCIIAPSSPPNSQWKTYGAYKQGNSGAEPMDTALREAEESISLEHLPWNLSLVEGMDNSAIILSMFHGIFDGGSLQLLLEDVTSEYHGHPRGRRTSIEHIVKHHYLADQDETLGFWKSHLEDYSPVQFPSITPYRQSSAKGTSDAVEITARTSYENLRTQSKSIGSTPLSVLQAAWGSILLSYIGSQEQDIVIGSVVSGRLDPESEACIGPTFTTVPFRLAPGRMNGNQGNNSTNKSLTNHLASLNAETLPYLQPRLGSLVTADGRLPYDTLLAWQDFGAGTSASSLWTSVEHPPMANDFAVMIEVWPDTNGSLTLRATYNDIQLDRAAAQVMLQQMSDIVAFILHSPDESFERALSSTNSSLKSAWNPEPVYLQEPLNKTLLHTQFEEHARDCPEDVALIFKGDIESEDSPLNIAWTYSELNRRADALAHHLVDRYGSFVNSPVPICITKSPAMYVAILGIIKAGGAWCPIDTFSPAQRRHDLIARTGARMLLVSGADGEQPKDAIPGGVDVVDISVFASRTLASTNGFTTEHPISNASPDDMAYLIWTSGTTGAPKGVPIKHSAAVSSMRSLQKDIPTDVPGGVRCLQFSQYTFDVSVQDIFYTWGVGGVLISASREIMLGSFAKLANSTQATHAHLTPAFSAGISRKSCETLQVITMIGEKLTQPVADDWGHDMRAFNTYGPAEVTVVSTVREFGNEHRNIKSANIGWPLETVSVFVMKDQKVVMKNAVGELALGGPQLSDGYLNQEETTKKRYIWNEETGQRLYYTGDLVRMLADGSLEYMTRVDDLVKLGGIRVELSEISFSLAGCHPLVEQVETMILSRPDRPTKVVVSFLSAPEAVLDETDNDIVLSNDKAVGIARAAIDQARSVLPDHMLPSVYVVVKNIPKTQSAKTDRVALQKAYASVDIETWEEKVDPSVNNEIQQDGTSEEYVIIDIISSLAGISAKGIKKSNRLASLGVDSIRAIRLASRLNQTGYQLSVIDVLQCSTVQDLISLATESSKKQSSGSRFNIDEFDQTWHSPVMAKVSEDCTVVRASPIQESLLSETMGTYNMYWSNHFFSLDKDVDLERLKQAWLNSAQENQALHAGFIPIAELEVKDAGKLGFSVLQLIYSQPTVDWKVYKCTPEDSLMVLQKRINGVMAKHQANYFRYPPWAVTILDKDGERVMVLTLHHSIHDGPSLEYIAKDVHTAYNSPNLTPPGRHQLLDALSIILPNSDKDTENLRFWTKELEEFADPEGASWPDLTGKRNAADPSRRRRFITEEVTLSVSASKLQSAAARFGVSSIASIVRAAWGCVSLDYLGKPATVFGETLSDRVLDSILQDVVGPLISVVPVPFHPRGTVREFLAEQQRLSTETWKHRHIHARTVQKLLMRSRGQALYPGLFTFHPVADSSDAQAVGPPLWSELEDQIGLDVEHPMALNVTQNEHGELILSASSEDAVMSSEHLSLFIRQVDALVSAMLSHPDENVLEIVNHLPAYMLSISNPKISPEVADSVTKNPTFWLEKWAGDHPEWTAVEIASEITETNVQKESMSFGDLNAAANRVAAYIAAAGVKKRMVALCSGRTLASYPIIAGIFKSGNTYLPIDEALPDDRKAFLIEDGNCAFVFTESSLANTFSGAPDTCKVICIDDPTFQESLKSYSPDNVEYEAEPDDISYLLYTSGSTGKPKGVLVTRGNLSSFVECQSEFICRHAPATLGLAGSGKYLALASRAFDVHLAEIYLAWRHGLATVTGPRSMLMDDLHLALTKLDITHASFVPSLLDQANLIPDQCPKLKYLSVGGEKISKRVVDTWGASTSVALVNAYGPTEVTIGCSSALVTPETNLRNIGKPLGSCVAHVLIPGTETYALRGQTGELCFTGDLVARGYLNRPDAKGFIDDFHGARLYRTGDIVRLMADDSIEYLGRGDDQTKIRGQRLELGEVSEVIRSSSESKLDVVTMLVQHPSLSRVQLGSFIARAEDRPRGKGHTVSFLESEFRTTGQELRAACQKKLPSYMVPELVIPVNFIPLAPMSGKADVKQLQALLAGIPLSTLLQTNGGSSSTAVTPSRSLTSSEEEVVKAILSVISTDASIITHATNIFEIGLDSLSAISLSVKLRNIGYEATVASVMSNPIVEQLAQLPRSSDAVNGTIGEETRNKFRELEAYVRRNPPDGIDAAKIHAVRPCLPLQEGLVARSMNSEGAQLYVNHITLELSGSINLDQLKKAWEESARENDILRTAFVSTPSGIVQVILTENEYKLPWDVKEIDDAELPSLNSRTRQEEVAKDIIDNISSTPPLRFRLVRSTRPQQRLLLSLVIHHSLYDGESLAMLLDEVAARYNETYVPKRGSAAAFVEYVHSQDIEKSKRHWTNFLEGCDPTTFRSNLDDVLEQPTVVHRTLGFKLSELEARASNLQTTAQSLVQAIFALLLADTVDKGDVTYGAVLSGRAVPVPGADSVLLPCITTIPGRLNTEGLASVKQVIKAIQESAVKSLEYQHTSLRLIQRWVGSEKQLFDCLFSYIRNTKPRDHGLWRELESEMPADYPFALEVEADNANDLMYTHCGFTSTFGASHSAENFLEKMDVLLSSIIDGADVSLDNFNLSVSRQSNVATKESQWDETSWSETDSKIRELVASFCGLGLETVSKSASFLSLGIDSVTAIQFARKLRESGFQASSADIMRFSCVGALSAHIESSRIESKINTNSVTEEEDSKRLDEYKDKIPILAPEDSISTIFECTPLQAGMITQTLASSGEVYVHPHIVQLSGSTDIEKLQHAYAQVVSSNDILRTSFHSIKELGFSWFGAVHSSPPLVWEEANVPSDLNIAAEVTNRFRLEDEASFQSPPLRAFVFNTDDKKYFVIAMHHALYDGVSLPYIFEDLASIYQGSAPPARPQFTEAVGHILEGQEEASKFWTQRLRGYDVFEIPPLPESESSETMYLAEQRIDIDLSVIVAACKNLEVTIQTVSLLAYAKVLACLTGRRDVVFGHVLAGRSLPITGGERTIGPLFNTIAERVTLDPKFLSNKALVTRLQQLNTDAQQYQHASLRAIQNALRQSDGLNTASICDTLFVFQKTADLEPGILDEQQIWQPYTTAEDVGAQAEHKLNVEVDHARDGVIIRASCKGQYISQETLQSLLKDFEFAFKDIIEHPSRCATIIPEKLQHLPLQLNSNKSGDESTHQDLNIPVHEDAIRQVLAEIAGVPPEIITPNTSIFSIGLDSIAAIRIAAACRAKGLKTGVADVLQGNTLRGISVRITYETSTPSSQDEEPKDNNSPKPPLLPNYEQVRETVTQQLDIPPDAIETILPCLSGQIYHLASWLKSGRTLFEPAWTYSSRERLDADKLQEAWLRLRQRHPILRTCFAALSPDEAVQVVLKEASRSRDDDSTFELVDSFSRPVTEAAQNQAREEALHPSSLKTPPVRLRLVRAADQDAILLLVNHAAYDAWTMPQFVNELAELYQNLQPSSNPDFPSFVEYSLRSLQSLDQEKFWMSALAESTPTILSRDTDKNKSEQEQWQRPPQLFVGAWDAIHNVSSLEKTVRAAGMGLQTIVLLAVARTLARRTQTASPTFGLYQTGRSASFEDIERLSGPCLNVTPFTVKNVLDAPSSAEEAGSFIAAARTIQSILAERVPYEQSSLRDILRWTGHGSKDSPLFNAWVNLLWAQPSDPTDSLSLFNPLPIGVPTDFMPSHPLPGSTSVDLLDTTFLPDEGFYIDIGPDPRKDTIGFGVRVEGGIIDEGEVRAFIAAVAGEIESIAQSLAQSRA
ncbi:NRPS protein [Paecilomyces lecythidis]